jgi:hypothetical protein
MKEKGNNKFEHSLVRKCLYFTFRTLFKLFSYFVMRDTFTSLLSLRVCRVCSSQRKAVV